VNAASLHHSSRGFLLGADAALADSVRLGVAGGHSRTSFDVSDRLSSGDIETVHGMLYAGTYFGAVHIRAGVGAADQRIDIERTVALGSFFDRPRASYDGTMLQGFGEVAYRMPVGAGVAEPFVQAAAVRISTDGFFERGGAAALQGRAADQELGFITAGLRGEARLGTELPVVARGMAGWRHAGGDTTPALLLNFVGADVPFLAAGAPIARDSLVIEAGLDYEPSPAALIGVAYAGALGDQGETHSLMGQLQVRF
jgi:outer membrane autotransporter protein